MPDDDLHTKVAELEAELARLRSRLDRSVGDDHRGGTEQANERLTSRRQLFKLGGAAAIGAAGATLASAAPASAGTDGDVVLGAGNDAGTNQTSLTSTSSSSSLTVSNSGSGVGLACNAIHNAALSAMSTSEYGVSATGGLAPLFLSPASTAGRPTAGNHQLGELFVDSGGVLYLCVVTGAPGAWQRIGGQGTAGALTVLPSTVRVYDSRPGNPPNIGTKAPLTNGQQRAVDCTQNSSGLPPEATAVLVNLTIVNTVGSGFLALFKDGITWPGNSSINWSSSGAIVANSAVVAASDGKIDARVGGPSTDFLIDLIGYYQ